MTMLLNLDWRKNNGRIFHDTLALVKMTINVHVKMQQTKQEISP